MVFLYRIRAGQNATACKVLATLSLVLLCQPREAMAHHMIDGEAPRSLLGGFISGLAHPVIGPDHLAFILAVGLIAAAIAGGGVLPIVFLSASLTGCLLHLTGVTVAGSEIAISVSVLGAGAFLAADKKVRPLLLAVGLLFAGAFHGYAYGESMVGSEPAPLVAYLLGLVVIQYVVAMGTFTAARRFDARSLPGRDLTMRAAGVIVGVVGVVTFALAL